MKLTPYAWIAGVLAAAMLAFSGSAQARADVSWSLGVAAPGVVIGATNAPPVYYAPPVYAAPAPVYVAPPPIYVQPSRYVQPYPSWGYRHRGYRNSHHGDWRRHQRRHHHR